MSELEAAAMMPRMVAKYPGGVNMRWSPKRSNNIFASMAVGEALPPTAVLRDGWWVFDAYVHESVIGPVPYATQIGDGAIAPNDCGQACAAMLARLHGFAVSVDDITRHYTAQGNGWQYGTYTSLDQAQAYLTSIGVVTNKQNLTSATIPNRVGIALIAYSQLSRFNAYDGNFYNAPNAYHFVVFVAADDGGVMVNDPLWPSAEQGQFRRWSMAEWKRAFTGAFLAVGAK